jgi:hypothetical protein
MNNTESSSKASCVSATTRKIPLVVVRVKPPLGIAAFVGVGLYDSIWKTPIRMFGQGCRYAIWCPCRVIGDVALLTGARHVWGVGLLMGCRRRAPVKPLPLARGLLSSNHWWSAVNSVAGHVANTLGHCQTKADGYCTNCHCRGRR